MKKIMIPIQQFLSRRPGEPEHEITTLKKEKIMLHRTLVSINSVVARPASRANLKRLATCLMFVLLSHLPVYADHIHHLWYNNSTWQDQDLTALTNGGIAAPFEDIVALHHAEQTVSCVLRRYQRGACAPALLQRQDLER